MKKRLWVIRNKETGGFKRSKGRWRSATTPHLGAAAIYQIRSGLPDEYGVGDAGDWEYVQVEVRLLET